MKPIFILVLAPVVGLVACSSQPRSGPPAPIESTGTRYAAPVEVARPTLPPPPPEKTVELYAYRPPSSAPDAVAPEGTAAGSTPAATATEVPSEAAKRGPAAPVPSERATPNPAVPGAPQGAAARPEAATSPKTAAPKPTASAQRPPAAPAPQVVAYVPPPPPAPKLPPAAAALAKQAEQQRRAGDYVGSAATLERALRIEPQEAYLWNRLARVRKEQGLQAQAGNMAARSNTLAKDQAQLKQDNWSIIAGARRAAGDAAGAAEAERKARGG